MKGCLLAILCVDVSSLIELRNGCMFARSVQTRSMHKLRLHIGGLQAFQQTRTCRCWDRMYTVHSVGSKGNSSQLIIAGTGVTVYEQGTT